jgi:tight adherence protein C
MIVVAISLVLVGTAVALLLRAAALPRIRAATRVSQIDAYGFTGRRSVERARSAPLSTFFDGLAGSVGAVVASRFGAVREAELRRQLMAAGLYTLHPRKFLGYRILCLVCVPAAWVWFCSVAAVSPFLLVVGGICAVLGGWTAPMTIVRSRARRRLADVDYDLPELIDLIVVGVEAGLGFNGALHVALPRLRGPLGDELRLAVQEQSMGLSTDDALRNMLARAETPAMRSFVRSVLQGQTLGVSIGEIMRNLAVEMRKRRRAAAEERAQKAPIKILFPLIFLIFPAMFLILLGPAVFSLIHLFGGGS